MKKLNAMISDERKAPHDYAKLVKQLHKRSDKKVIYGIMRQERMHYKKLQKMKRRLVK